MDKRKRGGSPERMGVVKRMNKETLLEWVNGKIEYYKLELSTIDEWDSFSKHQYTKGMLLAFENMRDKLEVGE